jgi:hypothetical protein
MMFRSVFGGFRQQTKLAIRRLPRKGKRAISDLEQ